MTSVTITFPPTDQPPAPPRIVGFRGLHAIEGGRIPDQTLQSPEVIPPYSPTVALEMTRDIQLMSYDLAAHFHPAIRADRTKWPIIHNRRYAMNNGTQNGYPAPGDENPVLHADYVNGRDLSYSLPRYDKMMRTFAGSLITGRLEGDLIWCEPGRDAIDARNFVYEPGTPEADAILQEILRRLLYSRAVADGERGPFRMGGHWGDGWIAFPFILDRPVSFEARFFAPWDETFYPEPLEIYV